MKKYSKTGDISYQTNQLKKIIDDGKINLARKLAEELIQKYPHDEILKIQLARINTLDKEYEKALSILDEIPEEFVFIKKTALCIKLQEEEKLYYLYQKYFSINSPYNQKEENNQKYQIFKIYLNKKYGQDYILPTKYLTYAEKQNINYDEELAISHIIKNHSYKNNRDKAKFKEHINIRELYQTIKETIKKHPNEGYLLQDIIDAFYIYYPSCGINKNSGTYDYIYVSTILGTNEILTMYPVSVRKNVECIHLQEKTTPKKKVRTKTGLERFNERYNIN